MTLKSIIRQRYMGAYNNYKNLAITSLAEHFFV